MLKARFPVLLLLAILGLLIVPVSVNRGHALQTGLVCLADVGSASLSNPCPMAPGPIFNGPLTSPIQQIRVGVFVNGSAGFNGFDITLKANSTVLRPAGIDLSGSILPGAIVVSECLGNVNLTNTNCNTSMNTADTLQFAGASFSVTTAPSTGLLFTAIYNITGMTSKPTSVGFQTGCAKTSVSGGVCVTFANGSPFPDSETVQGATFNNARLPPFLTISPDSNIAGPMTVASVEILRLNLTGQSGWNITICACPATLSTVESSSLKVVLNATSVSVPSSGSAFVAVNITGTRAGNFSLTVFAQYSTFDLQNSQYDFLVAPITLQAVITDFALSANPLSVTPVVGAVASSLVSATEENGFSGTIILSARVSGGQCGLSLNTILVIGSNSSMLNCSWASTGNYTVTVTGSSGPDSHTVQIRFAVQDFAVSLSSSNLSLAEGSSQALTITVAGLNGFGQQVSVSVSAPPGVRIDPVQTILSAPGTMSLSVTGESVGTYKVNVTVTSANLSHTQQFSIAVTAAPGGTSTLFGLAPSLFYTLVAVLGIVVTVLVVVGIRARPRSNRVSSSRPRSAPVKKC